MASIPRRHDTTLREETPFACVERVHEVELLATQPTGDWLPATIHLSVCGVGNWMQSVRLFVPAYPFADAESELEQLVAQAKSP